MSDRVNSLNIRHLRMVQYIGRTGAVSAASRELCTSQPAVTQAVANLEAELGTAIFLRRAKGSFATTAGKQYLARVDRFFEILDAAMVQVLAKHSGGTDRALPLADRFVTGTQLRALISVHEQGRVAPSVLRTARSLEQSLGRPLLDSTEHGPIANKTGQFLAREFRRAVRELELAHGEISLGSGKAGHLEISVGALPMAGARELTEATRKFMSVHPTVKVRLVQGEYHKLLLDLTFSRIDMIFGMMRKPEWASAVNEEVLFYDHYCMVARPGHPLAGIAKVKPADLAEYQWVVPPVGTPRRVRIEAIFEGHVHRPAFNLETSSLAMSESILLNSDTVTLMTRSEVQHDLDQGNLVRLRCAFLNDILLKGVTTNCNWLPTAAHIDFLNFLRSSTAKWRVTAAGSHRIVKTCAA